MLTIPRGRSADRGAERPSPLYTALGGDLLQAVAAVLVVDLQVLGDQLQAIAATGHLVRIADGVRRQQVMALRQGDRLGMNLNFPDHRTPRHYLPDDPILFLDEFPLPPGLRDIPRFHFHKFDAVFLMHPTPHLL